MKKRSETLWAGTEAALDDYLVASTTGMEAYAGQTPEEPPEVPHLLEIQGSVGVISIKGPLTNRDSWINRFIGVTSYNDIREAMVYAAQAPEVEQIMMDIDSGGGAVAGVADTASLIRMVNDKVKPVSAFSDGVMASAAYWLGSSAGKVYASKTAMVGSIGVIATHMEQSEALKKAGIGVTVMRAGQYKALANGVEPLTAAAQTQMQEHLDGAYRVFVQHVAEARNVSYDMADSKMAQGREFMGEASVGAGLVDGMESFDSLFNKLSAKSIDTSANLIDNHQKSFVQELGMGKKALSVTEIAALAEGGIAAEVIAAVASMEQTPGDLAAAIAEVVTTPQEAAATEVLGAAVTTPEVKADGVVEYLQGQVKEKDAALLTANIEINSLNTQMADMKAGHEGLLEIAGKSLSNMHLNLYGSTVSIVGMSATQVLAEHGRVSPLFAAKYISGGVAAVDAAASEKNDQPVDALAFARLNAVRIHNK